MSLEPGTTLGPDTVTAKIGESGMGEVYQVRDAKTHVTQYSNLRRETK